jgi:uncharacterized delta-60 repeat protein
MHRLRWILPPALVLLGLAPSNPAHAEPGKLDRFFSGDGKATAFKNGASSYGMAIDKKGRIVVVGNTFRGTTDIAIARFLPSGKPDPDFGGGDGRVKTDLGGADYAFDVAIAAQGRIIVAGERDTPDASRLVLVAYGIRGALDTSFGGGDGIVLTRFGRRFQGATAVAVDAKGRIIAGGFASNGSTSSWALARYLPDGGLDNTFGGDGKITTRLSASSAQLNDLASLPGGKIVAVGSAETNLIPEFAIARFGATGKLDPTFGKQKGVTKTNVSAGPDTAFGLAVQNDGKPVVVGVANAGGKAGWGIVRYGPKGRLDEAFSDDGKLVLAGSNAYEPAFAAEVQPNGRIVVAGRWRRPSTDDDMGLVRLKPGGGMDQTFGGEGRVLIDFFGESDTARDVVIQSNGKIVASGEATSKGILRIGVARVLGS